MVRGRAKSLLLGCTSVGVLLVAMAVANAGSFALREQSAYGQGSSFAGIAAGGALSSMYWNPATMTQFNGKTIEQVATGILPNASHSFTYASDSALGNAGNSGMNALVPSGYASWQLNDRFWLGLSVNAPFGLGVHFPQTWAGARGGSGESAKIETYNFAPTMAYKINDMISIAAGLQAQYLRAEYDIFVNTGPQISALKGAGWGFGWTAGVTLTPLPKTQIGIGYRSAIDQKVNGTLDQPAAWLGGIGAGGSQGSVNLVLNLPDMVTVGLRQGITERFTLLAGLEWTNWSRIGTTNVYLPNGSPALLRAGSPLTFPFQYKDGWYFSLGGEYILNPAWTVRAGIAFEKSPIPDDKRTVRIPDNDRMWYSVGASYKPANLRGLTFDAGYSFIDVKNAPICMSGSLDPVACAANPWAGTRSYIGSVSSYINIVSVAVRYQWDDEVAAAPKQRYTSR